MTLPEAIPRARARCTNVWELQRGHYAQQGPASYMQKGVRGGHRQLPVPTRYREMI